MPLSQIQPKFLFSLVCTLEARTHCIICLKMLGRSYHKNLVAGFFWKKTDKQIKLGLLFLHGNSQLDLSQSCLLQRGRLSSSVHYIPPPLQITSLVHWLRKITVKVNQAEALKYWLCKEHLYVVWIQYVNTCMHACMKHLASVYFLWETLKRLITNTISIPPELLSLRPDDWNTH